jgi:hypothetical protein
LENDLSDKGRWYRLQADGKGVYATQEKPPQPWVRKGFIRAALIALLILLVAELTGYS